MNFWPPQPGSTDMQSSTSASRAASRSAAVGVAGFSVAPAVMPSSWISASVWCRCGQVSTCTVHESAPAFANSAQLPLGLLDHEMHVERAAALVHEVGERRRRRAART